MRGIGKQLSAFVVFAGILLGAGTARASVISFQGTFLHDDDLVLIDFTLSSTTSVELMTWSYGGGINGNGETIAAGGFDPYLSLFDAAGSELLLATAEDGICGPQNRDHGNCYDADLSISLSAGDYIVALTESGNFANGPTFADGFSASGAGDFTGGPFLDLFGNQQDGHWALDLREVDSASLDPTSVPEPQWLGCAGLAFLALCRLRRRAQ
jgi:hypothetical protein